MKNYNVVLFDLDGTLTDSAPGIVKCVAYSLEKLGKAEEDLTKLRRFVGPPLDESYRKFYGCTDEEAKQGIDFYRERFATKGIYENSLYPNIETVLSKLYNSGKTIIMATSKPEHFAKIIAENFGIAKYFTYIAGATMDLSLSKKGDIIEYALKSASITDKSQVVMVGDREHDIIGAKQAGVDSIGVLYGYGNLEELQESGADYIAEQTEDILNFIL